MQKIRVFEAFAGYGSQLMALKRLQAAFPNEIEIEPIGISKTQQAKMAGNSIVVNVLYEIFRKMFVDTGRETAQLELF